MVFYKWLVLVKKWKKKDQLFVGSVYFNKIPSEMEVTPLLTLLTLLTLFKLLKLLFTTETVMTTRAPAVLKKTL